MGTGATKARKNDGQKPGNNKLFFVLLIVAVLVIAVLVGLIIYLVKSAGNGNEAENVSASTEARATIVTEDNVQEVLEKTKETAEAAYYTCEMNVEWNFKSAAEASYNAYVANSKFNTHTVYFDVNLKESGELVYSSPYIPVGAQLDEIKLLTELAKGDYDAIVTYYLVNDDKEVLSNVSVAVMLHVEQ